MHAPLSQGSFTPGPSPGWPQAQSWQASPHGSQQASPTTGSTGATPAWPMVPLRLTGLAIMLTLESVAAVLGVLFVAALLQLTLQGGPQPLEPTLAACVVVATMLLRSAALVLVRLGRTWARWLYVGAAAVGAVASVMTGLLPAVLALGIAAIVTIAVLFGRTTSTWLRWHAQRDRPAAAGLLR